MSFLLALLMESVYLAEVGSVHLVLTKGVVEVGILSFPLWLRVISDPMPSMLEPVSALLQLLRFLVYPSA